MAGEKYFECLCNINWRLLSLADHKSLSILLIAAFQPKPLTICTKVIRKLDIFLFKEVKSSNYHKKLELKSF